METNGGWGIMSHQDSPAYGLVRSELPHRTVVLRAAKCGSRAVGFGFSHRRLGWVL